MYKGQFQNFMYTKNVPQNKLFKPILKPKIVDLSPETEQIAKEGTPERELKQVLDKTFAKKKDQKRKKALKDSEEAGGEVNPEVASIRSNQRKTESESLKKPPKKKKKKSGPSIFDNY